MKIFDVLTSATIVISALPVQDRLPHLRGLEHHLVQVLREPYHVLRDVDPADVIHNPLQHDNNIKHS